jgi:hypothetical protein
VIAGFTATAVLLMSLVCACGQTPIAVESHEKDHDCCARPEDRDGDHHQEPDRHHDKDQGHHHDASCQCQPSMVIESGFSKALSKAFNHTFVAVVSLAPMGIARTSACADPWHRTADLPPPVGPPTLLSLGCAFNT